MTKRFWILTLGALASSAPINAQPAAPEAGLEAGAANMLARELEERIGGRTTLELKFEGLTLEEASTALAKASGLRFGPGQQSPWGRMVSTSAAPAGGQADGPRYSASVAKADFWPAVRAWSRAEAARMKREREALQRRQNEEKPPPAPTVPEGQTVSPEAMKAWQAQQGEWFRRRSQEMQRFDFDRGLSARFDPGAQLWSLSPGGNIATGRALSAWPCLVLATGFQRSLSLSIEEEQAREKPQPRDEEKAGVKAAPTEARLLNGEEAVEGGHLSDSLSLGLSVYLEPKLLERAKVQLQVNEARDDAGEDLLPARETGAMGRAQMRMNSQFLNGQGGGLQSQVSLRPRQSRGKKLAVLRGVVVIRYPMQTQEHEITDFSGPQGFAVGTGDLPAQGQFQPPRIENGQLYIGASLILDSTRGGRAVQNNLDNRAGWGDLLPSLYTFTDSQGRTWHSRDVGSRTTLKGPDGKIVPQTSPPTPPLDNFTYTEERTGTLQLMPEDPPPAAPGAPPRLTITPSILHRIGTATYISQVSPGFPRQPLQLSPEELAKVRFTKATFSTESDWRTLEVPFEFRDLPLPPR